MTRTCDRGFGPSMGALLSPCARAESECDIEGIRLPEEATEDLPRSNQNHDMPVVVLASVHQPDEAALPAARKSKCASKPLAVELIVALLAGDLPTDLLVQGRLDEPRFHMIIARTSNTRSDCVVG
jgi:hypothetical protein